jgi:hypothetical protein
MRNYVKPSMSNYAIKSSRKKCFRKLLIVNNLKRVTWEFRIDLSLKSYAKLCETFYV